MLFEKIEKGAKDIVFVYTTCGSLEEARSIGLSAVDEKLAISADYWFINSIYPWKNVIQELGQCMLMFTTQKYLSDKLFKHIEVEHSYNVPMIARSSNLITNQEYFLWVENTLSNNDKYITREEADIIEKRNKAESGYERLK